MLDFAAGAGNKNDSAMFDELYARVMEKRPEVEAAAVGAGYTIRAEGDSMRKRKGIME